MNWRARPGKKIKSLLTMDRHGDTVVVFSKTLEFDTDGELDIVDLTGRVREVVAESGIRDGMVLVFGVGATCAVTAIEYEPGLIEDFPAALERLMPRDIEYAHHRKWDDGNGHSHVRASFLGPSMTIPVSDGAPILGTWQQIIFVELDVHRRQRKVIVKLVGE